MKSGQIPSRKVLDVIAEMFPDEDLADLYTAAGYTPPWEPESPHDLPSPPGARYPSDDGAPIPLGPPISALAAAGGGDVEEGETIDVHSHIRSAGADYLLKVMGDCLSPQIHGGDLVLVKKAHRAPSGKAVVARVVENGFTGELGEGFTLKVWRRDGPEGAGFYRADGTKALGVLEAKIVGKVVGVIRTGEPSFK